MNVRDLVALEAFFLGCFESRATYVQCHFTFSVNQIGSGKNFLEPGCDHVTAVGLMYK